MKSRIILFFYFILLAVEIFAEVLSFTTGNSHLIFVTKPLLMPTLIVWAFLFAKENHIPFNKTIIAALIFSLFGDVSLMLLFINPDIFIIGLACFLIAHIIYIMVFIRIPAQQQSILLVKPYLVLPVVVSGGLLIWYLYLQNNHEFLKMQIPVIIYATVILSMLLTAISCHGKTPQHSFRLITIGALFFVVSDTTIALSKFTHLFQGNQHIARVIIMSLYGTAQYLIIKGYITILKKSTIQTN